MNEKMCSVCNQVKPNSEFYVSGRYLYPQCKLCKRAKDKITYHKSEKEKTRRKSNDKKSRRIRRLKAKIFVYDILSKSECVDCGDARFEVLEFDHIKGIKARNISSMVTKGLQVCDIATEVSKCVVRCANCHRIKTSKQLGWDRTGWLKSQAEIELDELQKDSIGKK